jgi:hypothetical protein
MKNKITLYLPDTVVANLKAHTFYGETSMSEMVAKAVARFCSGFQTVEDKNQYTDERVRIETTKVVGELFTRYLAELKNDLRSDVRDYIDMELDNRGYGYGSEEAADEDKGQVDVGGNDAPERRTAADTAADEESDDLQSVWGRPSGVDSPEAIRASSSDAVSDARDYTGISEGRPISAGGHAMPSETGTSPRHTDDQAGGSGETELEGEDDDEY